MSHIDLKLRNKLALCARLAKYAYVSGKPNVSERELEAECPSGYRLEVEDQDRFFSHSWLHGSEYQHHRFKSHAYVGRLMEVNSPDDIDRIVVGFRGTWLYPVTDETQPTQSAPITTGSSSILSRTLSWLVNFTLDWVSPSNYGLSDIYHDVTLIRAPYRQGVVWKWYTYWGTLILNGTEWVRWVFWPRRIAAGWVNRPYETESIDKRQKGLVHLGFWALWASDEGFAGYNRWGDLRTAEECTEVPPKPGVMQSVWKLLNRNGGRRPTEIFIVGHSLGGAVSCFAALDIASKLRRTNQEVKIFHATFGAPPVGTPRFALYFRDELQAHESWSIFHERDIVANCFMWLGKRWWSRWLGWWSDWSHVGRTEILRSVEDRETIDSPSPDDSPSCVDKFKYGVIGISTVLFLLGGLLAIPLSVLCIPVCFIRDMDYYWQQRNPSSAWKNKEYGNVTVKDHGLGRYIGLLGPDAILTDPNRVEAEWSTLSCWDVKARVPARPQWTQNPSLGHFF